MAHRKVSYSQIKDLHPMSHGVNLILKVVEIKVIVERKRPDGSLISVAEVVVGDSTGCVILTARNDQIALLQPGAIVALTNAKISMFRQHMRLVVDMWGLIEPASQCLDSGVVDTSHNVSEDAFELVPALQINQQAVPDGRFEPVAVVATSFVSTSSSSS